MTASRKLPLLHVALAAGLAATLGAGAQTPAEATLTLHFERAGVPVPMYTITLHGNGTGTYTASYMGAVSSESSRYGASAAAPAPPTEVTAPVALSVAATEKIFQQVHDADFFRMPCESRAKGIANTGAKTFRYAGPSGASTCTFNYSDLKPVSGLFDTLQAVANMMDEGRTLDIKHRYDRLGLDREMRNLVDAVHEGRALEVGNIAPVLQSIAEDGQVLERVRKQALGLLEQGKSTK